MHTKLTHTRRGISGLMQVAMIIGIVIIFASLLFTFASDIFNTQTIADSISLQKMSIQKVGTDSFLSVNVKNTGNVDVTNIQIQVQTDTDNTTPGIQPFVATLNPATLAPGITGSVYTQILDSNGNSINLPSGQQIAILVEAVTADGSIITESNSIRIR